MNSTDSSTIAAPAALVLRSDAGGIATVTLNRPAQFNALSGELLNALQSTLDAIAIDASVRVVVLAGAGRAFCAGHDLKEMLANSNEEFVGDLFRRCCDMMLTLAGLPQPVIARVHGIATAAGCQLVAACDLAVAASDARFAASGINFGLFCATPLVPLARNIPRKRAFEMAFIGDFVDTATASEWGLVNRAVEPAELDAAVLKMARSLMEKPADVIAAGKAFFYLQIEQSIADAYRNATAHITCNLLGDAAQEGVSAFIEKRMPAWRRPPVGPDDVAER
ncbi:MAG: enoyl-CoA hydratase [Betaproteobacteria bacterium]